MTTTTPPSRLSKLLFLLAWLATAGAPLFLFDLDKRFVAGWSHHPDRFAVAAACFLAALIVFAQCFRLIRGTSVAAVPVLAVALVPAWVACRVSLLELVRGVESLAFVDPRHKPLVLADVLREMLAHRFAPTAASWVLVVLLAGACLFAAAFTHPGRRPALIVRSIAIGAMLPVLLAVMDSSVSGVLSGSRDPFVDDVTLLGLQSLRSLDAHFAACVRSSRLWLPIATLTAVVLLPMVMLTRRRMPEALAGRAVLAAVLLAATTYGTWQVDLNAAAWSGTLWQAYRQNPVLDSFASASAE